MRTKQGAVGWANVSESIAARRRLSSSLHAPVRKQTLAGRAARQGVRKNSFWRREVMATVNGGGQRLWSGSGATLGPAPDGTVHMVFADGSSVSPRTDLELCCRYLFRMKNTRLVDLPSAKWEHILSSSAGVVLMRKSSKENPVLPSIRSFGPLSYLFPQRKSLRGSHRTFH